RVGRDLRDLPRVGVVLSVTPGLERLGWFGRGPWEDYPDRLASTVVGRFVSTVAEQYVPYILPQEHGRRGDVRRLSLTGDDGTGPGRGGAPAAGFHGSALQGGRSLRSPPHVRPRAPRGDRAQPRPRAARDRNRELRPGRAPALPARRRALRLRVRLETRAVG